MNEIDERFAYITTADGRRLQVLVHDPETGEPVDWDEAATAELQAAAVMFQSPTP